MKNPGSSSLPTTHGLKQWEQATTSPTLWNLNVIKNTHNYLNHY